ncbi:MAG: hypothetical protein ACUVT7_03720 [Thermoplasmata archaeon]
MATVTCPLCGSPCILKVVAMEDEDWCKVDVCKLCLTMYPREGEALRRLQAKRKTKAKAKPRKWAAKKKPRKR